MNMIFEEEQIIPAEAELRSRRLRFLAYNTYHMLRTHYRYYVEKFGSLGQYTQDTGELKNLFFRTFTKFTNRRDMVTQISERELVREILLLLLTGSPTTFFLGMDLKDVPAEVRREYFLLSAENGQLLYPGIELQYMFQVAENEEERTMLSKSSANSGMLRPNFEEQVQYTTEQKSAVSGIGKNLRRYMAKGFFERPWNNTFKPLTPFKKGKRHDLSSSVKPFSIDEVLQMYTVMYTGC